jgi:hypothetical protein
LKQRIALRYELQPFDLRETAAYIAKRIRVAGGNGAAVFTRQAVEAIQHGSHGIARTISVICDNSLISGFALQRKPVDADVVLEVCRDFDLPGTLSSSGLIRANASANTGVAVSADAQAARAAVAPPVPAPHAIEAAEDDEEDQPAKRRRFLFF